MQTDPNLRCEKTTNILNVSIFILSIFLWTFSDLCDHLIIIHIWPFFFTYLGCKRKMRYFKALFICLVLKREW